MSVRQPGRARSQIERTEGMLVQESGAGDGNRPFSRSETGRTLYVRQPSRARSQIERTEGMLVQESGAGDGNRTHVISLGSWDNTIIRHPH